MQHSLLYLSLSIVENRIARHWWTPIDLTLSSLRMLQRFSCREVRRLCHSVSTHIDLIPRPRVVDGVGTPVMVASQVQGRLQQPCLRFVRYTDKRHTLYSLENRKIFSTRRLKAGDDNRVEYLTIVQEFLRMRQRRLRGKLLLLLMRTLFVSSSFPVV